MNRMPDLGWMMFYLEIEQIQYEQFKFPWVLLGIRICIFLVPMLMHDLDVQ